jgi:hypothetical protein
MGHLMEEYIAKNRQKQEALAAAEADQKRREFAEKMERRKQNNEAWAQQAPAQETSFKILQEIQVVKHNGNFLFVCVDPEATPGELNERLPVEYRVRSNGSTFFFPLIAAVSPLQAFQDSYSKFCELNISAKILP